MTGLENGFLLENGKYRVEKVIGRGGFGITYLGEQVSLGRKVAIKEFFMKDFCNRDRDTSRVYTATSGSVELVARFRAKFIKEANNLARFHHPNIVLVIDVFEENDTAYYVMEYHSGGSLADKVKNGPLAEADAVKYIRQLADALAYIHSMQVMHLDVKPANILLDGIGNAVLIDFGLSKQYDDAGHQTSTTPVGFSHGYAPMEQYKNGGVSEFSPVSDIYSLGATLYKLVTGLTPPDANDVFDSGLPKLPASLSAGVRSAIEKSMQPRRAERPQNIGEFLTLLDTIDPNSNVSKQKTEKPVVVPHEDIGLTVVEIAGKEDEPAKKHVARGQLSGVHGKYIIGLIALLVVVAGGFFVYNGFIAGKDSSNSMQNFLGNGSGSTASWRERSVNTPGDLVMIMADVTDSAADKLEKASSAEDVVRALENYVKDVEGIISKYAYLIESCENMETEEFLASYPQPVAAIKKAIERFMELSATLDKRFEFTPAQQARLENAVKRVSSL